VPYLPAFRTIACNILLADDDTDDCQLFTDALHELNKPFRLTCEPNGERLMKFLNEAKELPDIIFLDLNMPRKNGFECLSEIKKNELLCHLPVVIISTSFDKKTIDLLYQNGANYYLRKPNDFPALKRLIDKAVTLVSQKNSQPPLEEYVLSC